MPDPVRWLRLTPAISIDAVDPFPGYRQLREAGSVVASPLRDCVILSRHRDVQRAFREPETFSSRYGVGCDGMADPPTLLDLDPPAHGRQRRNLAGWFTHSGVLRRAAAVRAAVAEVVDSASLGEGADLMPGLCERIPAAALCGLLGLPTSHLDELVSAVQRILRHDPAADAAADQLTGIVARYAYRAGGGPLAQLGAAADPAAFRSSVMMLFLGGQEPMSTLAGAVLHAVAQAAPGADPGGDLAALAEEVARLVSPTQFMFRQVVTPVTVGGTLIEPGTRVLLSIAAANLDGAAFTDPERCRPHRPRRRLSYGAGPHVCLGQWLTRLAVPMTVELVWRRLGRHGRTGALTLVPGWSFSDNVRCLDSLVVRVGSSGLVA